MSAIPTPAIAGMDSTDAVVVVEQQPPAATSQLKRVYCKTCGSGFRRERNLRKHEATHDGMQREAPPEVIARRLKYNTDRNNSRRKLRANDPTYREKERRISATNRVKKKAGGAAKGNDVANLYEDPLLHEGGVSNEANEVPEMGDELALGGYCTTKKSGTECREWQTHGETVERSRIYLHVPC
ncbi:hypothetical protein T484DRAFT_1756816 [Baffinella frigidus]|nr:hypothetical protein T484DRAFT_1756816 [Cryptophyta sp. CCMP2293]